MTKIKELVWKELTESPSIRLDLSRKLINIRALAKYLQQRIPGASLDAIISAIRRYEEEQNYEDLQEKVMNLIKGSTLSSKNKIASIMLKRDEETMKMLPMIGNIIEAEQSTLRFVHTQKSIKLFIDEEDLKAVKAFIPKEKIKLIEQGMGEVIIDLSKESWNTPGVLWKLTSELFLNNINICETLTCIPEIIFLFKEDVLMKAYEVLYRLSKEK